MDANRPLYYCHQCGQNIVPTRVSSSEAHGDSDAAACICPHCQSEFVEALGVTDTGDVPPPDSTLTQAPTPALLPTPTPASPTQPPERNAPEDAFSLRTNIPSFNIRFFSPNTVIASEDDAEQDSNARVRSTAVPFVITSNAPVAAAGPMSGTEGAPDDGSPQQQGPLAPQAAGGHWIGPIMQQLFAHPAIQGLIHALLPAPDSGHVQESPAAADQPSRRRRRSDSMASDASQHQEGPARPSATAAPYPWIFAAPAGTAPRQHRRAAAAAFTFAFEEDGSGAASPGDTFNFANVVSIVSHMMGGGAAGLGNIESVVFSVDAPPDMPAAGPTGNRILDMIHQIMGHVLAGQTGPPGTGVLGDYVLTNTAFDNIITQLMEQEGLVRGSAPPPAPEDVLAALPRRRLVAHNLKQGDEQDRSFEACAICKDEFELDDLVIEIKCSHAFHEDCLLPWLRKNGSCPICRYSLNASPPSSTAAQPLRPARPHFRPVDDHDQEQAGDHPGYA